LEACSLSDASPNTLGVMARRVFRAWRDDKAAVYGQDAVWRMIRTRVSAESCLNRRDKFKSLTKGIFTLTKKSAYFSSNPPRHVPRYAIIEGSDLCDTSPISGGESSGKIFFADGDNAGGVYGNVCVRTAGTTADISVDST